ncbi:MAG TPA: hypothetical protein VK821_04605 [Dehalococcoidia bacterium]|nr:hypothetical protein [Dehalococcoidia bacterium]
MKRLRTRLLGLAAAGSLLALAIGSYTIGYAASSRSGSSVINTTTEEQAGYPGPRATPAPGAANGPVPTAVCGQVPQGWYPGSGTLITGAAADEATAVGLPMIPGGTVDRVLQLSDGSYVVHIIGTSGPHHAFVSQDFTVTGVA